MPRLSAVFVCAAAVCCAAVSGSPIMASVVANGDFEAAADGNLSAWKYSDPLAASPSAAPAALGGARSARLNSSAAAGRGQLSQKVSATGAGDFTYHASFAIQPISGGRTARFIVFGDGQSVAAVQVGNNSPKTDNQLFFYGGGQWNATGLFARETDALFAGAKPNVNRLTVSGHGYGTATPSIRIGLNGETYTASGAVYVNNRLVTDLCLFGEGCAADWLADDVSFVREKPEDCGPDLVKHALVLMGGAEEIVFAVRDLCSATQTYATFGEYSNEQKFIHAPDGSRLSKLNLRTGQASVLLDDPKGGVRDPRVHYDGDRILFSYRKGGTHHYHLCEIGTDGSGFRQLTFGEHDNVDPAYLPDGGIIFASSRCNRFIGCNRVPAATLYRIDADGGNPLCLSANPLLDDRPAVLSDGRVIYTRWEYTDRAAETFRDLWVMNPDGTGQMVFFGGAGRPYPDFFAKCDALPIPAAGGKIVSVFSPALGHRENAGNVMIVDPDAGPEDWSSARQISPKLPHLRWTIGLGYGREGFRDPYPLSEDCFLVARDTSLLVMNGAGRVQEVHRAEKMVHDPRVIRPRPREPVIPPRIDLRKTTGQLVLANVYHGRSMEGVRHGTIKQLLVLEDLPKGFSQHGLPGYLGWGLLTLRRVLGTVPVEPDGSASFEVPPMRAVYFVALDENGLAVKRMQSITMVMPGETQGCVGCHERRTDPPALPGGGALAALKRSPSRIRPVPGMPEVFDYRRDIQPIWDKHCIACHDTEKAAGRVVLTGDNNEWFTQSFYALFAYDQVSHTSGWSENGNNPPYGFGTAASPLMQKIDGSHYGARLAREEYDRVRLWIESSAPFAGTLAVDNRRENAVATSLDTSKVTLGEPVEPIVERRCLACHGSVRNLGRRGAKQSDDQWSSAGKPPEMLNYPLHCWNLYNLSHPEKSMILLAPLASQAGGYQWCKGKDGQPLAVFPDTRDPDYLAILQAVQAAGARQAQAGRYDLPGWRPNEHYVRWMKRFGILPESFDPAKDPIDPFETDAAYWRSLWHRPGVDRIASWADRD